jgi:hypothetical protein
MSQIARFLAGRDDGTGGLSEMVPEGTNSQDQPSDSAFMDLFRSHERTETRLVADTYYLEEGGSG